MYSRISVFIASSSLAASQPRLQPRSPGRGDAEKRGGGCLRAPGRSTARWASSLDQVRERCQHHRRVEPLALDRVGQQADGLQGLRRPAPRARGSRPPARPRRAARRRCGCATSGRARWPRGRRSPLGPRTCGRSRRWPAPGRAPRGRCRRRPCPRRWSPWAWVAPTATAAAFFATPASSTPTVIRDLADDLGALKASATPWAMPSSATRRPALRPTRPSRARREDRRWRHAGIRRRLPRATLAGSPSGGTTPSPATRSRPAATRPARPARRARPATPSTAARKTTSRRASRSRPDASGRTSARAGSSTPGR